ncbi:tRNA (adenine(22)-N(1))-methyltransferase [Streptococcus hongkongensis]|nr:SAM-dependent methyltransferase [Streptococcus uberis]
MDNLSQRLTLVANFIPKGSKLLDVGSDHAYLPIYLVKTGVITSAIAGEVVKGPFESAQKNVTQELLADKIDVRLANGLAAFDETDKVTAISICGMGGRLIAEILEAGKDKLATVETLVLQPNNREDDLRRWLTKNDFVITAEKVMSENDKFYEIILAQHGHRELSLKETRFGPILGQEKSVLFKAKWQRELDKLSYALSCIPEDNLLNRSAISQRIDLIKEMIEDEN